MTAAIASGSGGPGRAARTIRQAVTEVEQEWAQQLGAEDLDVLRTLLSRLAAAIAEDGPSTNGG